MKENRHSGKDRENHSPLVSVIMAAYNEKPEVISEAVRSVLIQTYKNIELLIYDDSSNEKTKSAIDVYSTDQRVKIRRFPDRLGFVKSLNKGLDESKGVYIARMDGDDFSLPTRLEKQIRFLNAHPEISIVGGQINLINEAGQIMAKRNYPVRPIAISFYSCIRCPLAHPTVVMRREIIEKGFRYDETLKICEDLDLWLRLINEGFKIANIPDVVLNYRISDNFVQKRSSDEQRRCMASVRKKNFEKRRMLYSTLSVVVGWLFAHVPVEIIRHTYENENNEKATQKKIN